MTVPVFHALGGVLKRKGRGDGVTPPPLPASKIGVVGDSLTYQGGNGVANLTTALGGAGWTAANIRVSGLIGRYISAANPAPGALAVIDSWAAEGFNPEVIVVALGTNDVMSAQSTSWSASVDALLSKIASALPGAHRIFWVNAAGDLTIGTHGSSGNNNIGDFNRWLSDKLVARTDVTVLPWSSYVAAHLQSSTFWLDDANHVHMTAAGYAQRNTWLAGRMARVAPGATRPAVLFGVNAGGVDDPVSTRLTHFGRLPMQRWYYGVNALPTTFNTAYQGGAPEKRTQVSFKWAPSEVNAGSWDSRFDAYFTSAPADWSGLVTYWHEPNAEISGGDFTATEFKNATIRLSNRLAALGITDRWKIAPNFTSPYPEIGSAYARTWVPTPDQLHPGAMLTWDAYGNLYGGTRYNSPYRFPVNGRFEVLDPTYAEIQALGWWHSWGITEFNTPPRNFDGPVNPDYNAAVTPAMYQGTAGGQELQRTQWLSEFVDYCLYATPEAKAAYPGFQPPKQILLWEGNGVQFDQKFYTDQTRDLWREISKASI